MSTVAGQRQPAPQLLGRMFVHPAFDYLLIGGGLSLIVTAIIHLFASSQLPISSNDLAYVVLFANSAHFAASTVRLYTKPGSRETLPFLTMAFPAVFLLLLTVCLQFASSVGVWLQQLYLNWSPYHYAAQAYGLAVMYSYRSGCQLRAGDKRLLWWISMLPFFFMLTYFPGENLDSLLRTLGLAPLGGLGGMQLARNVLSVLVFLLPIVLFAKVWTGGSQPMPLISLLAVVTNGVWFVYLSQRSAFAWATIFHGIQYLAIVIIFHVRDQQSRESPPRPLWQSVLGFYAACVALGYVLFQLLPYSYIAVGFGPVESVLLVAAAINIHHFIVDAYIWRMGGRDRNRQIVFSAS